MKGHLTVRPARDRARDVNDNMLLHCGILLDIPFNLTVDLASHKAVRSEKCRDQIILGDKRPDNPQNQHVPSGLSHGHLEGVKVLQGALQSPPTGIRHIANADIRLPLGEGGGARGNPGGLIRTVTASVARNNKVVFRDIIRDE